MDVVEGGLGGGGCTGGEGCKVGDGGGIGGTEEVIVVIGFEYVFVPKKGEVIILKRWTWWLGKVGDDAVKEHGGVAGVNDIGEL